MTNSRYFRNQQEWFRAFHRFVIEERFRKPLYMIRESIVKSEQLRRQALCLKWMPEGSWKPVALLEVPRCLEQMRDSQIQYYHALLPYFKERIFDYEILNYFKYYILEVLNLVYHDTVFDAWMEFLAIWDQVKSEISAAENDSFFLSVACQFYIYNKRELSGGLEEIAEREKDFLGDPQTQQIREKNYTNASDYVMKHARLLREEEKDVKCDYVFHCWNALPMVLRNLEENLPEYHISELITLGEHCRHELSAYPVFADETGMRNTITVSEDFWFRYLATERTWSYYRLELMEAAEDLLNLIHLYTESFVRKTLGAKPRKRSAARVLRKELPGGNRIRMLLQDERFEALIGEGVAMYMKEKGIAPAGRKKKEKVDIDHEQRIIPETIDLSILAQARKDADRAADLLLEGEVKYEKEPKAKPLKTKIEVKPDLGNETTCIFDEMEKGYLLVLLGKDPSDRKKYSGAMPDTIMMKNINRKAQLLFSDIILERVDGLPEVVEDQIKPLLAYLNEENK